MTDERVMASHEDVVLRASEDSDLPRLEHGIGVTRLGACLCHELDALRFVEHGRVTKQLAWLAARIDHDDGRFVCATVGTPCTTTRDEHHEPQPPHTSSVRCWAPCLHAP